MFNGDGQRCSLCNEKKKQKTRKRKRNQDDATHDQLFDFNTPPLTSAFKNDNDSDKTVYYHNLALSRV